MIRKKNESLLGESTLLYLEFSLQENTNNVCTNTSDVGCKEADLQTTNKIMSI